MGTRYVLTEQYTMEKLLMHGAFNLSLSAPITSSVHTYRSDIFTLLFPRNMKRDKAFFFSGIAVSPSVVSNAFVSKPALKNGLTATRVPNKYGVHNVAGTLLPRTSKCLNLDF
jgi:hypothetical protein